MGVREGPGGGAGGGARAQVRVREEGLQVRGGGWKGGTDLVTGEISATHAVLGSHKGLERRVWYSGELGAESQWRDDASEATVHTSPGETAGFQGQCCKEG